MTDEQLQRAARRVAEVYDVRFKGDSIVDEHGYPLSYANDAAAVATLREEMGKANEENCKAMAELFPFVPHTDDDPTKSFVATARAMTDYEQHVDCDSTKY